MLKLTKRERYILIVTALVVGGVLFYNLVIEGYLKKSRAYKNEIFVVKTKLRKGIKILEQKNDIIEQYNSYAATLKNSPKILRYIEHKALSSGIKTSNVRPRALKQQGLYKEHVIELEVEGEIDNIVKFILELGKVPVHITLKKFDLRKAKDSASTFKGSLVLSKLII